MSFARVESNFCQLSTMAIFTSASNNYIEQMHVNNIILDLPNKSFFVLCSFLFIERINSISPLTIELSSICIFQHKVYFYTLCSFHNFSWALKWFVVIKQESLFFLSLFPAVSFSPHSSMVFHQSQPQSSLTGIIFDLFYKNRIKAPFVQYL